MKRTALTIITLILIPLAAHAEISIRSGGPLTLSASVDEITQQFSGPFSDFVGSLSRTHFNNVGSSDIIRAAHYPEIHGLPAIPHDLTLASFLDFVKQLILFVGGFLVVVLRVLASIIETIISWLGRL